MTRYDQVQIELRARPKVWLVTGVAGFIGSNLLETLLRLDQKVVGLDNLITGFQHNLDKVKGLVSPTQWSKFSFINGDICNLPDCQKVCSAVDYVLHQAAVGSVPRSIADPLTTNLINVTGFLNMLLAARDAKVQSFTYAASSSTYGDHPALPKVEVNIGKPLSPYAVTKYVNELYADVFSQNYGFKTIGLRYFNVFGPRQDPKGSYAAVIPLWTTTLLNGEDVHINGDGETSRDFCYVDNAVQANILAATADHEDAVGQVYNVAVGERTSLNQLYCYIRENLPVKFLSLKNVTPNYRDFRIGDVRHSHADISKATELLGYAPTHDIVKGLKVAVAWYVDSFDKALDMSRTK